MRHDATSRRDMLAAAVAGFGFGLGASSTAQAADADVPEPEARVRSVIPSVEAYVGHGMTAFDVPGCAVGIIVKDRIVYAQGFGVRSRKSQAPVGTGRCFKSARPPRPSWPPPLP